MKPRIPRKLKKKYKKMGIWKTYQSVGLLNFKSLNIEPCHCIVTEDDLWMLYNSLGIPRPELG